MFEEIASKIARGKAMKEVLNKALQTNQEALDQQKARLTVLEQVQALIQTVAKETQEKLRFHIEDIVNTALETCFPGEYDFVVDFQIKRGKTEAELYLLKGSEKIDPVESTGGGVVDIVSFALRISAWTLSKTDNLIILDEPGKFISDNLQPLFADILSTLSKKLNLQIIMVSHEDAYIDCSDRVFNVSIKNGRSTVNDKLL